QRDSSSQIILESSQEKTSLFRQKNFSDIPLVENWEKVRKNYLMTCYFTKVTDVENSTLQRDSSSQIILESSQEKTSLFRQKNFSDIPLVENWEKVRKNHLEISPLTSATVWENSIAKTESSSQKILESFLPKTPLFRQTNFSDISLVENWEKVRENHLMTSSFTRVTGLESSTFHTESSSQKILESFLPKTPLFRQTNFSDIPLIENWEKVRENYLMISSFTRVTDLENSTLQTESSTQKVVESSLEKTTLFRPRNFSDRPLVENWEKVGKNHLMTSSFTRVTDFENSTLQTDSSSQKILESSLETTTLFRQRNFSDRPLVENWEKVRKNHLI
ncbi:MAG: hypothetical protein MGU50_14925, partial [Trichodesmium sp. MAG_R02]|nr:hypothetical protein [Trichodesmium sp. MAG_R02]